MPRDNISRDYCKDQTSNGEKNIMIVSPECSEGDGCNQLALLGRTYSLGSNVLKVVSIIKVGYWLKVEKMGSDSVRVVIVCCK